MRKVLLILLVSCSSLYEEKLQLESIETHDLAIKIGDHVNEKIERARTYNEHLQEPLKSLLQDSLEVLTKDYTHWKSTIIEVPGYEHHEHDHVGHNHTQVPNLTPDMVLDIQKDLRDRIVKLNIRIQKLLDLINEDKNEII